GLVAVRRGGAWLGIATGAPFALAFTVKEIALPLAPVPFLAAIAWGLPWRRILGSAGLALAPAARLGLAAGGGASFGGLGRRLGERRDLGPGGRLRRATLVVLTAAWCA